MSKQKKCQRCEATKSAEDFYPARRSPNGLQSECKACQASRYSEWYAKNRERKAAQVAVRKAKIRANIVALKLTLACVDCGWSPSTAGEVTKLDFDHENPDTKHRGSTQTGAFSTTWSWERIEQELKLCVARCHTCHMARTTREGHRQRRYQDDPEMTR
jgi:hypothetical protein